MNYTKRLSCDVWVISRKKDGWWAIKMPVLRKVYSQPILQDRCKCQSLSMHYQQASMRRATHIFLLWKSIARVFLIKDLIQTTLRRSNSNNNINNNNKMYNESLQYRHTQQYTDQHTSHIMPKLLCNIGALTNIRYAIL